MLSIDHILIPVDFSERSIGAARYARLLACTSDQKLRYFMFSNLLPTRLAQWSWVE
jgi:nucleotide-binding universal stress UspA family protein